MILERKTQYYLNILFLAGVVFYFLTFLFHSGTGMRVSILWVFLLCFIISFFYFKYNYFLFFYLAGLFLFQYGRIVLSPLLSNELPEMNWFATYKFSPENDIFVLNILFLCISGLFVGLFYFSCTTKIVGEGKITKFGSRVSSAVLFLSFLSLPFFVYSQWYIIKQVREMGYLYLFASGYSSLNNTPLIVRCFAALFTTSVLLNLSLISVPSKTNWIKYFLFIVMSLVKSLSGSRMAFFGSLLFVLSSYCLVYKKRISAKAIIFVVLLAPLLSASLNMVTGRAKSMEGLIAFLNSQGTTGTYLILPQKKPSLFEDEHVPYILASLFNTTYPDQSYKVYEKMIKGSKSVPLAYKMSTEVNLQYYLDGQGMGGSNILEMYDAGREIGVFIFAFLSVFIFVFLVKNALIRIVFFRILIVLLLVDMPYSSRSSYLLIPNLSKVVQCFILYCLLAMTFRFYPLSLRLKRLFV